jgi:magnesium-transporting ATPase (P-type)
MMTFLSSENASSISFNEVISILKTDIKYGLSESEILQRRKLYSFNEFEVAKSDPLWKKYLEQVILLLNRLLSISYLIGFFVC